VTELNNLSNFDIFRLHCWC